MDTKQARFLREKANHIRDEVIKVNRYLWELKHPSSSVNFI